MSSESTEIPLTDGGLRDRVADLEELTKRQVEYIEDLEDRLEGKQRQIDMLKRALAGRPDEFVAWQPEQREPILDRLRHLEEDVEEYGERVRMYDVQSGGSVSPDDRAMRLRQVLYNKAKQNDGRARLDRDAASSALGGGLSRASVIDAMRRAANGKDGEIHGSSSLKPLSGAEFVVGEPRKSQSAVTLNVTNMGTTEIRHNVTTKDAGTGGEP